MKLVSFFSFVHKTVEGKGRERGNLGGGKVDNRYMKLLTTPLRITTSAATFFNCHDCFKYLKSLCGLDRVDVPKKERHYLQLGVAGLWLYL